MNPKLIVIDGKTYHSVDEMPSDIRQKYEQAMRSLGDANDNRIPDAFETVSFETVNIFADKNKNDVPDVLENIAAGHTVMNSMKIIVDGKEFNGLENLPPEARTRYEEAMGKLDANRNGVPDFAEGMINTTNQTANISTGFGTEAPRRSTPFDPSTLPSVAGQRLAQDKPLPVSPTITPDTSNGWALALAGVFLLLVCALSATGVWYFFLR